MKTKPGFIPQLEALRGILAMCVVAEHTFHVVNGQHVGIFDSPTMDITNIVQLLTYMLFDGRAAIFMFFALSGYVLKIQWDNQNGHGIRKYLSFSVRRLFRIVPALWISTLFIYMLIICFNAPYYDHTFANLLSTLALQNFSINGPLWTVRVELYCSLALPLLFWLNRFESHLLRMIILLALAYACVHRPFHDLSFMLMFYMGIIIHNYGEKCIGFFSQFSARLCFAVTIAVCALLPRLWVFREFDYWKYSYLQLVEALPCFIIISCIVYCLDPMTNRLLLSKTLRLIGKVSFGIYLLHVFIIFLLRYAGYAIIKVLYFNNLLIPNATRAWLFLLGSHAFMDTIFFVFISAISIFFALILHRFIEMPMNRFGHTLGRRIEYKAVSVQSLP
jgi:peptidoglycan/LPS O-acetylase OafA/YrhL